MTAVLSVVVLLLPWLSVSFAAHLIKVGPLIHSGCPESLGQGFSV